MGAHTSNTYKKVIHSVYLGEVTKESLRELLNEFGSQATLAREYGISGGTVSYYIKQLGA